MSKTFTHAGVSRLNGEMKFRVANDALRVKVLAKNGHKDIDLIELTHPMAKEDAVAFLLSIDFATRDGVTNQDVQDALLAEVERLSIKTAREAKPKATRTPKAEKPTLEKIKSRKAAPEQTEAAPEVARDPNLEDAPF